MNSDYLLSMHYAVYQWLEFLNENNLEQSEICLRENK